MSSALQVLASSSSLYAAVLLGTGALSLYLYLRLRRPSLIRCQPTIAVLVASLGAAFTVGLHWWSKAFVPDSDLLVTLTVHLIQGNGLVVLALLCRHAASVERERLSHRMAWLLQSAPWALGALYAAATAVAFGADHGSPNLRLDLSGAGFLYRDLFFPAVLYSGLLALSCLHRFRAERPGSAFRQHYGWGMPASLLLGLLYLNTMSWPHVASLRYADQAAVEMIKLSFVMEIPMFAALCLCAFMVFKPRFGGQGLGSLIQTFSRLRPSVVELDRRVREFLAAGWSNSAYWRIRLEILEAALQNAGSGESHREEARRVYGLVALSESGRLQEAGAVPYHLGSAAAGGIRTYSTDLVDGTHALSANKLVSQDPLCSAAPFALRLISPAESVAGAEQDLTASPLHLQLAALAATDREFTSHAAADSPLAGLSVKVCPLALEAYNAGVESTCRTSA